MSNISSRNTKLSNSEKFPCPSSIKCKIKTFKIKLNGFFPTNTFPLPLNRKARDLEILGHFISSFQTKQESEHGRELERFRDGETESPSGVLRIFPGLHFINRSSFSITDYLIIKHKQNIFFNISLIRILLSWHHGMAKLLDWIAHFIMEWSLTINYCIIDAKIFCREINERNKQLLRVKCLQGFNMIT